MRTGIRDLVEKERFRGTIPVTGELRCKRRSDKRKVSRAGDRWTDFAAYKREGDPRKGGLMMDHRGSRSNKR